MSKIKRIKNVFSWVIILSEVSHIFCCVLPSVFSILTMVAGLGLIGITPIWMTDFHDIIHGYELPLIMLSGTVLVVGIILHLISERMDCHDTGCVHGSCEPKKKNTARILKIATILFVANVVIYFSFHYNGGILTHSNEHAVSSVTHSHENYAVHTHGHGHKNDHQHNELIHKH